MEIVVRGFLFDDDERILLVKHAADQMWVLPGGHLEEQDEGNIYTCLQREVEEETGLDITIFGPENQLSDHHVVPLGLPISIHKAKYEHREKGKHQRMEYRFFAYAYGDIDKVDNEEIYDYMRVTADELGKMRGNTEVHTSVQEVLEQNLDLLELL